VFIVQYKANLDFKFFVWQEKIDMSPCVSPVKKVMIVTSVIDKGELTCKLKQEKT
jgi:hypothetical protein